MHVAIHFSSFMCLLLWLDIFFSMLYILFLGCVALVSGQTILFEDEFNTLDCSVWEHEITAGGGGNWEFQYYTNNRSNSYVRDGILYIKPTLTEDKFGPGFVTSGLLDIWGNTPPNECTGAGWYGCFRQGTPDNLINPIQSARLRSSKSFNFRYGRVEISAQMPKGDWLWPAIWLLPRHNQYGDWPASGEMDMIESRGNLDMTDETGQQRGNTHGGVTLHWGPFFEQNKYELSTASTDTDFGDSFHTFALEWGPDNIALFVDGVQLWTGPPAGQSFWQFGDFDTAAPGIDNPWAAASNLAPFDQEYYIVMNVAVGGTNGFFPDTWTNAGYPKPWINTSPTAPRDFWNARDSWYPTWAADVNNGEQAAMKVDYVRVTELPAKK